MGRGGGFEDGHHGGHFDGHGFHHFHGHDFVVVPFGFGGYYGPYDTYCSPVSVYYDPAWCWDYYNE